MARFLHHDFPTWWRKCCTAFLASSWLLGLIVGCLIFYAAGYECVSWMRAAADSRVSIVGLLSVIILPFLFSAFAVYISHSWLLLIVAFGKAVSFSLVSLGILISFGSAGWLMRFLLMFSDLCALPLLFLFWMRFISGERRITLRSGLLFSAAGLVIGSIDFYLISPILAGL